MLKCYRDGVGCVLPLAATPTSFRLGKHIFHPRFDYDFRRVVDGPGVVYTRGGVKYQRPVGSDRKVRSSTIHHPPTLSRPSHVAGASTV